MEIISYGSTYASGMRRLAAFIIDGIIISIIFSILFHFALGWEFDDELSYWRLSRHVWSFRFLPLSDYLFHSGAKNLFYILYCTVMESSCYQGTLGKIALGIKVVNNNNQRISITKALLRNLSKLLSALICGIGFILIIFDDRKQALHDKIADTFVVKS